MSRQRRMDAIARRRAFIDTQLQLLSSNEARIPNIIRSRTTGSKPRPRYHFSTPSYHLHQTMEGEREGMRPAVYMLPGDAVPSNDNSPLGDAGASPHHHQQIHQEEVICRTSGGGDEDDEGGGGGGGDIQNQMYVSVGNGDTSGTGSVSSRGGGAGATTTTTEEIKEEEEVPIAISNADIAKMLSSNEELMKSLQTIQTDDGTVMVVLEGGDFGEGVMGRQLTDEDLASSFGYSEEGPNDNTNVDELPEFSEGTAMTPSAFYPTEEIDQVPVAAEQTQTQIQPQPVYIDGDKEPYVLVQTSEGNVLIPSSMVTQSQPQEMESETVQTAPTSRSGGGIVEFVAAEGGAIEQLIRKRSATPKPVTKKMKKANPTRKLGYQQQGLHGSRRSASTTSSYLGFNGNTQTVVTSSHSRTLMFPGDGSVGHNPTSNYVTLTSANANLGQEKPRPFRFELPEEIDSNMNDLNENFMSVPIPITIDSLRSETGSRNDEEECESFSTPLAPSGTQITPSKTTNGVTQCSEKTQVLSEFRGVSQTLQFKCIPCSKVFNKESDLHLHSQQSHPKTRGNGVARENASAILLSSVPNNARVATTFSHSEESQIKLAQNQLILNDNIYTIESSNQGDDDTVYIQFVDADDEDEPTTKKAKIGHVLNQTGEDETVLLSVFDEAAQGVVGRRTLNKASAKANMFSEIVEGGAWECPPAEENGEEKIQKNVILSFDKDGQPITIQSARIRARNDRVKALDQNETNEDEIGDNFQKIFMQVCSETRC